MLASSKIVRSPPVSAVIACDASTPITELEAVIPVPANKVASAVVVVLCSAAPSESKVANESPSIGVTALSSDKSSVNVTSPVVPPPD